MYNVFQHHGKTRRYVYADMIILYTHMGGGGGGGKSKYIFFTIWGHFCYFFFMWGTVGAFLLHFSPYGGGLNFHHAGVLLLLFSPCGRLFCPYGGGGGWGVRAFPPYEIFLGAYDYTHDQY